MSYELNKDDILDFARSQGIGVEEKGNEVWFDTCPYCHCKEKYKFSVNSESGAFKCFKAGCDHHGHFVELCRDFNYDLGFENAVIYRQLPQPTKVIIPQGTAVTMLQTERGITNKVCRDYQVTTHNGNKYFLCMPFFDENGILQTVKYRNMKFKKGDEGAKEWFEKETMPIIYGMWLCKDFDRLILTEGQLDAMSVAVAGYDNACSVPNGATAFKWLTPCGEWINRFKEIIVFGDYENGKITLVDTLQSRVKPVIKVVRKCDYLGEKDANDILRKFGADAIRKCIDNAEIPKMDNVKRLADVEDIDFSKVDKIKTGFPLLDKTILGMCVGQLIVLTGRRGEGKSTFLSQIVANVLNQNESVFVYSGELPNSYFKGWLNLQIAGTGHTIKGGSISEGLTYTASPSAVKEISKWYRDRAYIFDSEYISPEGQEEESLTDTIERVIKNYNVRFICVDNIMTAMETVDAENFYYEQGNFVNKLKCLAQKWQVVILLVVHPRKTDGKSALKNDDVSGSGDITNRADTVLTFSRADTDLCSNVQVTKNRTNGKLLEGDEAIPMIYDPESRRIVEHKYIDSFNVAAWKDDWRLKNDYAASYGWEKTDDFVETTDLPF